MLTLPPFIALCGNPKAGKSTAAEILEENFGVLPVDDGLALRRFAVEELGLTWDQVYSQQGKAEFTEILGRQWQNRVILGELGKALETLFGEHIMPFVATRKLWTGNGESYSFGSVRKTQGGFYKQKGGIVVEIHNPQAQPSGNDFDAYDESLVDYIIINDGLARGMSPVEARLDLAHKLGAMLVEYSFSKGMANV